MAGIPKIVNITSRALQFVWTLLIMALIGNMLAQSPYGNPAIINYYMFTAVFSMLSLFYLFPATFNEGLAGHSLILMSVDALNLIFTFCAAVALPAYIHVHQCANTAYTNSNFVLNATPVGNQEKRCREAQASTAFMWFLFASFAASLVLDFFQGRAAGANLRGGVRRPQMSQA